MFKMENFGDNNKLGKNYLVNSEEWISNGVEKCCQYRSRVLNGWIKFTVYIPDTEYSDEKFPVLFFLPGVGSNEKNFLLKTGYQKYASKHRFIVVGTDTKPDFSVTETIGGKSKFSDAWYIDALVEPYSRHFKMYSYVSYELPNLVVNIFPNMVNGQFGICGHSMGGHGAIICGLRNPEIFKSISTFAPACNPLAWGQCLIFRRLLGEENKDKWSLYDSCALVRSYSGPTREILLDQGNDDYSIDAVCQPTRLVEASKDNPDAAVSINLRIQRGFGHSSDLLAAFFEDHFKHHKKYLSSEKIQ